MTIVAKPVRSLAGAIVALNAGHAAILGIAVCWLGLFLPGILMIYAVLPWWGAFRNLAVYRRCGHPSNTSSHVETCACVM